MKRPKSPKLPKLRRKRKKKKGQTKKYKLPKRPKLKPKRPKRVDGRLTRTKEYSATVYYLIMAFVGFIMLLIFLKII